MATYQAKQMGTDGVVRTPDGTVYPSTNSASAPINRTIDQSAPTSLGATADETFLNTFKQPETRDQIADRKRRESQGVIDSIQKVYDDRLFEKRKVGDERLAINNATSVLSGLMGSTEAGASRTKVLEGNEKEVAAVNNERAYQIASIYRDISSEAEVEAREQLADATRSAEAIATRRAATQTKAVENLKLMASAGLVDFDAFKSNPQNKAVYDYAVQATGSEDGLRAMFMLNRPKNQIVGQPVRIGNKYIQAYQNPITGKVAYEQMELPFDLPTEYNNFQQMGDNLVAIPDGWDGDTSKLRTVGSTLGTLDRLQIQGQRLANQKASNEISKPGQPSTLAEQALSAVTVLEGMTGKSGAIGTGFQKLVFGAPKPGTAAASYLSQLEQVKSLLTLPNLSMMKGLGAMSDREFATISSAVANLNPDMKEHDFDREVARIKTSLQTTVNASGAAAAPATGTSGNTVRVQLSDGRTGTINASEFDPSSMTKL